MICRVLLFVALFECAAGCSKPPAVPLVDQQSKQEEADQSSPSPAAGWANSAANPESPLASPVATPAPVVAGFSNPAANESWNQYVENFQAIKSLPTPQIQDPLNNPAEVTGYLNQLGNQLRALQQSRQAVEANLSSPEEKKRFRAAEKSLFEGENQ